LVTPAEGGRAVGAAPAGQHHEETAPGRDAAQPVATPAEWSAPAPSTGRETGFRPRTGAALVELLETGISVFGQIETLEAASPLPADVAPAPAEADAVVPVEQLLYAGRAALDRARAVRDELRARPGPPDPALLEELYDLLDLAARS
jgi:hypothetical protein